MLHAKYLSAVALSRGHAISALQTDKTLILALRVSKLFDAERGCQRLKLSACLMVAALQQQYRA